MHALFRRSSMSNMLSRRVDTSSMDGNFCKQRFSLAEEFNDIKPLKRNDFCTEVAQRPFCSRPAPPIQDSSNFADYGNRGEGGQQCSEQVELKVGFLYEIDHEKLPRKSPIQVEGIRAVLVTGINEFNVSVRTPSTHSLRTYFGGIGSQNRIESDKEKKFPDLDKQFVMGSKLARQILVRQISPSEFTRQRHLRSFWLLPSKVPEITSAIVKKDPKDENSLKGVCWSSLNSGGLVRWGVRKRVSYLGRHSERHNKKIARPPPLFAFIKEEEDVPADIKSKGETKSKTGKRKHEGWKHNKKLKIPKCEVKVPINNKGDAVYEGKRKGDAVYEGKRSYVLEAKPLKPKCSYGWWSQDRYKNAEVKMMEIMKTKGAVCGKPILRHALRMEARKHIGDTGLLDHVLKNMADKVTPNGEDRFRRRHNADGAMEYWLESADLVNIRREAGVKDPYWTPPPGWKPGDNPSQDHNFAWELKLLKEEMSRIKKDVQEELHLLKREDEVDKAIVISTKSSSGRRTLETDYRVVSLQEDYANLVKRKAKAEQQLAQFRKRKYENGKHNRDSKEARRQVKKSSRINGEKMKLSYGRWSQDRYTSAEVKMLEIMKSKGAVCGKPMVRQALRMEARKHIGDTGLLDHILKHMADKVAPNGLDRFRRRHNADGAMEYWLESADLVNIRREAGVKDPYWVPPPGWKPGDNPSQDPNYARELKLLKEEMSNIENDVQTLLLLKKENERDRAIVLSKSSSESCNLESDTTDVSFQEDYENSGNRKAPREQQLAQLSESSDGMQDFFLAGNNFHMPRHDATSTSGIHQTEQGSIASFLVGPHHQQGTTSVGVNNFFRIRPCDFDTSQPLDKEPKESSFILLV